MYSLWNNDSPNKKTKRILLMPTIDDDYIPIRTVFVSCLIGLIAWALAINFLIQEIPEPESEQVCIYVHSSTMPLQSEVMCGKVVPQ